MSAIGLSEAPAAAELSRLRPLPPLKKRRDFLACASARRAHVAGLLLQARQRRPDEVQALTPRVGYTCSKKIGNAVVRNRAKRRLREAARLALTPIAREGWDYVLVGRPGATVARPFADLMRDLEKAVAKVHAPRQTTERGPR